MKLTLFPDYKEENWHSMDIYASQLFTHLHLVKKPEDLIRMHVTLPSLSRLFPSQWKYMRLVFRYIVNPIGVLFAKADVYHITDHANAHLILFLDPAKTVITCHDLTAPYWMEKHVHLGWKKRIRHAVEKWRLHQMRKAACIIAVSEATKQDIVKWLQIAPQKIVVIHEGINPVFFHTLSRSELRQRKIKYGLPDKFFLNVGSTYTNKNIEGLIQYFSSIATTDKDLCLVKVGDPWTKEQYHRIQASPYVSRIIHCGYVPDSDLPAFYQLAYAYIQPSLAEGFGFTVLEAMASKCPAIVSDLPAHREIARSTVWYFTPHISSFLGVMKEFVTNKTKRMKKITSAYQLAKRFTWDQSIHSTLLVYEHITNNNTEL